MDKIEKIYAKLPTMDCKGLCAESCGPIVFSQAEADRMVKKGITPPGFDDSATCTALRAGRCSIYANRPLVCRLFGASQGMICRHGCKPSRMVSDAEFTQYGQALGPLRPQDYDTLDALRIL